MFVRTLLVRFSLGLLAALLLAGTSPTLAAPATGVLAWGDTTYGQLGNNDPPPFQTTPVSVLGPGGAGMLTGVTAVSAGDSHSLALKGDGTVWAYGDNRYGQLGDGTATERSTPVQVLGYGGSGFLTGISAISAGFYHNLVLKTDGSVWAWGYNGDGELGQGAGSDLAFANRNSPVPVIGTNGAGSRLTNVKAVSAGHYHNLALMQDGTVWTWGANYYGELGDGTTTLSRSPVQVLGQNGSGFLGGVAAVAAGDYFSLALKTDGTVWAWGFNGDGELGDGTTTERLTPVQVVGYSGVGVLTGVTSLAAGAYHSLALKNDGSVSAWGSNGGAELGDGTNTNRVSPVQVVGPGGTGFLTTIAAVKAGASHSSAVKSDGSVWTWGSNDSGQLGDGTTAERLSPVQVLGQGGSGFFTGAVGLAAGNGHSLALKSDGTVSAWGSYSSGQLGDGSAAHRIIPVQVSGPNGSGFLSDVSSVAAAYNHSLALKSDGSVWSWGDNVYGDLGDGTTMPRRAPVQVVGYGGAGFLTGIAALAAGTYHSMGVKTDGTVWTWGDNTYGELGDGTTTQRNTPVEVIGSQNVGFLTGVATVAAGDSYCLALKADGTVWAWGNNPYGQLGDGTTLYRVTPGQVVGPGGVGFLTGITAVAAGGNHSLALKNDGTVWAWGYNGDGALGDNTTTDRHTPVQVVGRSGTGSLTGVIAVAAGGDHSMALMGDGTVWAWGNNTYDQLGNRTATNNPLPTEVLGPNGTGALSGITALAAGKYHSLALKNDGTVWAWGINQSGELGDNAADFSFHVVPTIVLGSDGIGSLQGVTGIAAGGQHSLAVQSLSLSITGFAPTSGPVGASVTISGYGFTGASAVKFNGVPGSYAVNSDTSITASVPPGASTGPISVTTPAGTATSSTSFTVPAPSGITFTPTAGSLGSMVTISGSGFSGATSVKFNGADSSFSVNSDTSITDFVPYTATTGPISVTTPAGTGTSATNFTVNAPAITSFNPNNGSVGATVNIIGSAFTAASAVKFNGVGANFVLNSDTSITATVPFGATTGPISVTSPAGTGTSATNFTVNPPSITNFSPTSGPIGSFVTLTGTSFTGVTAVKFGSISANFFYSSDTQINATVPPGFVSGMISVITPAGTGTTAALTPANFTVPGPVITNLNPNNGSLRSTVVINGSGFTSASGVKFNGVSANYYINLDTQIVAFVPDTATTGPVTVTTPSGTSPGVTFTVNPPVITGFNPTHGSIGSYVTISGSGFTLASGVSFGGVSASFFVSTDTSISAQVPVGFVSGTISVTGPIGTGTSAGTFTVDAPAITGFSPTHGAAGTNVTVNGSSFTGATSIQFNGVTASLFVANDGQINTTVPAGATTGPITVTGPGGTGTSGTNFTVP